MGVGQARNRTRRAVERTVPFGLICFSVVTVWYTLHGHAPQDVTGHRTRARWYTTKTEPSYDDMAVKLRRVIIAACGVPEVVPGSLTSDDRWSDMIPTCRCGCSI